MKPTKITGGSRGQIAVGGPLPQGLPDRRIAPGAALLRAVPDRRIAVGRPLLRDILERVEGILCGMGFLPPRMVRSKGGLPDGWKAVALDLEAAYEAFLDGVQQTLGESSDGVLVWDDPLLDSLLDRLRGQIEKILVDAVDKALDAGLEAAAAELGNPDIVFTTVDPGLVDALKGQAINLGESTVAKIKGDLKRELLESARLGETMHQAIKRVKGISSLSDYEAERIVRTEMATAANAARLQGYKGRLTHVVWVLGPAYNGGCACAELAGVYSLEDAFSLKMPLHPNCDCYWRPATEEEALEAAA